MSPADVDALLLDFGGVIVEIDFDRVFARWARLARVPFEQVRERFSHRGAYERHECGRIDAAAYYQSLRESLGIALDDAQLAEGWMEVFVAEIAPTVELLPRLARRVPLHLFSNTNFAHYEVWSRRYAAALAPVGRRFISCEMGMRKPHPETFEHVARELAIAPGRILFFDDTEANVEGARAAGLRAVHVRGPEDLRRAVAPWLD